jgi:ribosomal protein L37AE/L43A
LLYLTGIKTIDLDKKLIKLSRTAAEWAALEAKIKASNKKDDAIAYINRKIKRLIKDFEECPDCITQLVSQKRQGRGIWIDNIDHEALVKLSEITNTPIATIIDRGIIQTYLIEKA